MKGGDDSRLRSATSTGMQSAVWIASSKPGSAVIRPSPRMRARRGLRLARRAMTDQVGVKLAQCDQWCSRIAGDGFGQEAAVVETRFALIVQR